MAAQLERQSTLGVWRQSKSEEQRHLSSVADISNSSTSVYDEAVNKAG
jgi:hypothetical protein